MPLVFFGRSYGEWSSIIGSFELPKIAVLRVLVGLMASLWLVEWGLRGRAPLAPVFRRWSPSAWVKGVGRWLQGQPTRWLTLAVVLYLGTVLLSTALSSSLDVSLWGDVPGQDSYSAYTLVAYILLFGVIATHLKTPAQLWRLLGAVTVMGVLVAGYAMFQHYGNDFFNILEPFNSSRATSTMGNPLFAGSVLLMTIPITLLAATMTLKEPATTTAFWSKLSFWSFALAIQLLGIIFTSGRGPWVGTLLAVASFLALVTIFLGWRTMVRAAIALVLAAALASAVLLAPLGPEGNEAAGAGGPAVTTSKEAATRFTGIPNQIASGGLSGRIEIWKTSWQLMVDHPWVGFDSLSLSFLRPLIGYGPELFRSTYLLESPPGEQGLLPNEAAHAHNYFLHEGVELGFLGLVSSLGVFASLFLIGGYQLLRRGQSYSPFHILLLIGLLATLGGRLVEQMVGVARVSDLTIFWVLLAAFVALPVTRDIHQAIPDPAKGSGRAEPWSSSNPGSRSRWALWKSWRGWRLLLVAGLIVGIAGLTWLKSIDHVRAALIVDEGASKYRGARLQAALASLDRAIDLTPNVSTYYERRAHVYRAYLGDNRPVQGLECANGAGPDPQEVCVAEYAYSNNLEWVEQRPQDFRARLALADSALNLGLLQGNPGLLSESTRRYRQAADMVPNSATLWNILADVHLQLDQPAAALPALERSLAITQDHVNSIDALLLRARAYQDLEQPQRAIQILDQAIRVAPGTPQVHYLRGASYYKLGQATRAIAELDEATRLNPQHANAYYLRGTIYDGLGRPMRAIEDLDHAIRLAPEAVLAYNNRGLAYARLGRIERAIADWDLAVTLDPDFALAYNNRGFAYRELGQLERAIQDLDRAINLDSQFPLAYYNRALVHVLQGEDSAARQDADRAVEQGFDPVQMAEALEEFGKRR